MSIEGNPNKYAKRVPSGFNPRIFLKPGEENTPKGRLRTLSDDALMSEFADITAKLNSERAGKNDDQATKIQQEYDLFEKEIEFRRIQTLGAMGI